MLPIVCRDPGTVNKQNRASLAGPSRAVDLHQSANV
jgi:hypothetical protein